MSFLWRCVVWNGFKSDLCHDSNRKFEILQTYVCQEKQINKEACMDSICIGQHISYDCWSHIVDNDYLDGNGLKEEILNANTAF